MFLISFLLSKGKLNSKLIRENVWKCKQLVQFHSMKRTHTFTSLLRPARTMQHVWNISECFTHSFLVTFFCWKIYANYEWKCVIVIILSAHCECVRNNAIIISVYFFHFSVFIFLSTTFEQCKKSAWKKNCCLYGSQSNIHCEMWFIRVQFDIFDERRIFLQFYFNFNFFVTSTKVLKINIPEINIVTLLYLKK